MKRRKKDKMNSIDKILLVVAIMLVAFITAMIATYWKFQSVPDTLITMVLGAGGLETVMTAAITIAKNRNKKEKDDNDV